MACHHIWGPDSERLLGVAVLAVPVERTGGWQTKPSWHERRQGGFLRSLDHRKELVHLLLALVSQRTCLCGYCIARGEPVLLAVPWPHINDSVGLLEVSPTDRGGCQTLGQI